MPIDNSLSNIRLYRVFVVLVSPCIFPSSPLALIKNSMLIRYNSPQVVLMLCLFIIYMIFPIRAR